MMARTLASYERSRNRSGRGKSVVNTGAAIAAGAAAASAAFVFSPRTNDAQRCGAAAEQATSSKRETINPAGTTGIQGSWTQDVARSESMQPFLEGLGIPWFLAYFIDYVTVDLDISIDESSGQIQMTDWTWLGSNVTNLTLAAPEVERVTRGGRKKFMLSGYLDDEVLTIKCRLFQRGPGWYTLQSFKAIGDRGNILQEQYSLYKPADLAADADPGGNENHTALPSERAPAVVVTRMFTRKETRADDQPPTQSESVSDGEGSPSLESGSGPNLSRTAAVAGVGIAIAVTAAYYWAR